MTAKPTLKVKGFLSFERGKVYKTAAKAKEIDTKTTKQAKREAMLKMESERMERQRELQRKHKENNATAKELAEKWGATLRVSK